jgi:hypothetical protein
VLLFGKALSHVSDVMERNRILTDLGAKGFIDQGSAIIGLATHYDELTQRPKHSAFTSQVRPRFLRVTSTLRFVIYSFRRAD